MIQNNLFKKVGKSKVIKDSILTPNNGGLCLILSLANMAGKPENPLYPLFDKKWKKVKEDAKVWFINKNGAYKPGAINTTIVQSYAWVVHMLCQNEALETDVKAVKECLGQVCKMALSEQATVHVSTILTSLIPELSELCKTELLDKGVSVFFYEEP